MNKFSILVAWMLFIVIGSFDIQHMPDAYLSGKLLAEQAVNLMDTLRQASVPMSLESAVSIGIVSVCL